MTLDEAERQAHDALSALRREYERQAAPYIETICRIHALRPRVFYVPMENGKPLEMIPMLPVTDPTPPTLQPSTSDTTRS